MQARRTAVGGVLAIAAAATVAMGAQEPEAISQAVLLGRAAWYVDDFLHEFSNVVAEEVYVQDSSVPLPSITVGRGSMLSSSLLFGQMRHRRLKADFLLVRVEGGIDWVPFRDVFEVDGIAVRDREARLTKLFLHPSKDAYEQADRIRNESARYNLGSVRRTINNPVLPLAVLHPDNQQRFKFTMRQDPSARRGVYALDFKEETRPTIILGRADHDLFSSGTLWIEGERGALVKAEMTLAQPGLGARVVTTFKRDDRFTIAVPDQMEEQYVMDRGAQLIATANYGRFRRFDVSVDERVPK